MPRTMSQKLIRELCYLVRDRPHSEASDRTIASLLHEQLALDELIFCRCNVKSQELARQIEQQITEKSFSDTLAMVDLLGLHDTLYSDRLKSKLYQFAQWLVTQNGYCDYLWLVAKLYPDLRRDVGERLLRDDYLDVRQIAYIMKMNYLPLDLKDALTKKVASQNDPLLLKVLRDPLYA